MKLAYEALNKSGKVVRDVVDAADRSEAIETLRRQGFFVTEIREAGAGGWGSGGGGGGPRTKAKIGRGKRLKCLAMFARQLHVLVATGIPLTQSLEALERQVKPGPWKDVLADLFHRVEEGAPLSEAMAKHPAYFDAIVRSMVEAGETGGNLVAMLDRMASLTKKQLHVRSSIVGAMVYPALLMVVSVNVMVTMLTFVLPRFAELFKTLDSPLPPATKFLMAVSFAMRTYWWGFILAIGAAVFACKTWLASDSGRRTMATVAIRAPKFGVLIRNFITARVVRTLGVLLQSKVQLLDALRLTRLGTPNHHYADLLARAETAVTRGDPISSAFSRADLIPPNIYEALRNGERTGQVGPLLLNMAEFMDEENEVVMKSLTSIIEPLILIVLGAVVGAVALAMFMPLFDLTAAARGGG
jgi:type II secretory pathway component PulF